MNLKAKWGFNPSLFFCLNKKWRRKRMNKNFNRTKKISVIFILALFCLSLFSTINTTKAESVLIDPIPVGSSTQQDLIEQHKATSNDYKSAVGQSVEINQTGYITQVQFGLKKASSPNAVLRCALTNVSGTYGTGDNVPNSDLIVGQLSTNTVSTASLTTAFQNFNFTFANFTVTEGDIIGIFVYAETEVTLDLTNKIYVQIGTQHGTTPYAGNKFHYEGNGAGSGFWEATSTIETTIQVYGLTIEEYEELYPTPTPEVPTPTPTPTMLPQITVVSNIIDFLFGTNSGNLGNGFGLLVWLGCAFMGLYLAGKNVWGLFVGTNVAFIINVIAGLWGVWTLFLLVLLDAIVLLGKDRI
jgi:hypothetical protein